MSTVSKGNDPASCAVRITLTGSVQGVGFRPHVFRLAHRLGIKGWVANTSSGVLIHAQGSRSRVDRFTASLTRELPINAVISSVRAMRTTPRPYASFSIRSSATFRTLARMTAEVPPDIALCPLCRKEMDAPSNRRYRYPFINCTVCGPRYSITSRLPYDRPHTTMRRFVMCPLCQHEYDTPSDRRFHAQPNACPACGPRVVLQGANGLTLCTGDAAVSACTDALRRGKIIAVKGIGGYHLACAARSRAAVMRLRARKERPDKPLAVMIPDPASAQRLCYLSPLERSLLCSSQAPIVLARKRPDAHAFLPTIDVISPDNAYVGIMLPYTPLHHLLCTGDRQDVLVMTSGNKRDEPICKDEPSALTVLSGIADLYLSHDRPIHNRCDDSIVQTVPGTTRVHMIRRSRGYVPAPVRIPCRGRTAMSPVLAVGADLKNTLCMTRNGAAYLSPYIGDLDDLRTLAFLEESRRALIDLLGVSPRFIAHDLHPEYHSSRYARAMHAAHPRMYRLCAVQHHRAHIASVCAEHSLRRPVIGFAFDGTGYGDDGAIWGGECFVGSPDQLQRTAHIAYFRLPGGEKAITEIWRIAVSLAMEAGVDPGALELPRQLPLRAVRDMVSRGINAPQCSSVGRLFDGVAAILGLARNAGFEAHAAMMLEACAVSAPMDSRPKIGYTFHIDPSANGGPLRVNVGPVIAGILADKARSFNTPFIAYRFHLTIVDIMAKLAANMRVRDGIRTVVLSGGVFQNRLITSLAVHALEAEGFTVLCNQMVPSNDGGISLGQAYIASLLENKAR